MNKENIGVKESRSENGFELTELEKIDQSFGTEPGWG
jgi:hypothetical protein